MNKNQALSVLRGILKREFFRFLQQKSRLLSAIVRPLIWLLVFASGFRSILGISIIPPYQTYIPYPIYIIPGFPSKEDNLVGYALQVPIFCGDYAQHQKYSKKSFSK
ncbi:MAG: hypothetical protein GY786_13205 [Proteobacteria bacterium]|nr:hypothetical protein [Pseudomonadota bacterium]